jgi:hypothetical protein
LLQALQVFLAGWQLVPGSWRGGRCGRRRWRTSAYVSGGTRGIRWRMPDVCGVGDEGGDGGVRQHTSAYVSIRMPPAPGHLMREETVAYAAALAARCAARKSSASVRILRQHTSAYVSIRQHTSAYVSIRQHTSAYVSIRQHTSAYVSILPARHGRARARPGARAHLARAPCGSTTCRWIRKSSASV